MLAVQQMLADAGAIQGFLNCADNLTLYALSSTINGWLLDQGGWYVFVQVVFVGVVRVVTLCNWPIADHKPVLNCVQS